MRKFHQGQKSKMNLSPDIWEQYSLCHERIFLAIPGGPYMVLFSETSRGKPAKEAVYDRGYRGRNRDHFPSTPLKRDTRYQRDKQRKRCRRHAAIEPIIGHLKSDFRLTRNFLKGAIGDLINVLMAACAWNLNKWLRLAFLLLVILVDLCERAFQTRFSCRMNAQWEPSF